MLSTAPAVGCTDGAQYSWNDESSTARTSDRGSATRASSTGRPMLPHALTDAPAAVMMASTMPVVVVLPLVPVTTSHCRGGPVMPDRSTCQASSTSPHTGRPASAAATSIGLSGRKPGEVTTRSKSSTHASRARISSTVDAAAPSSTSGRVALLLLSHTVTDVPWPSRNRIAEAPAIPAPATRTRCPHGVPVPEAGTVILRWPPGTRCRTATIPGHRRWP